MEGSSGGGDRTQQQVNFESELSLLKRQIDGLQVTVHSMQHDTEKKDKAIAALARDKEQLAIDLKRQRRSNANLKQQLEDERRFYYKEKEQYCNEMNSYKKMKRQEGGGAAATGGGGGDHKKEISHLKNTLNQTLEANYNLSVKFLRMKSSKSGLKNRLASLEQVHERTLKECRTDFEKVQNELNEIVRRQFAKPIPPSSKKYLQVIKQNGALIHDNLCLQLEIDRLHLALDRMRVHELKVDTNSKLQFMHNGRKTATCCRKSCKTATTTPCRSDCAESKLTTSSSSTSSSERKLKQVQEEEEEQQQHHLPSPRSAKYELMTVSNTSVSENTYYTSVKCCPTATAASAYRTQSAPEIVRQTNDKPN